MFDDQNLPGNCADAEKFEYAEIPDAPFVASWSGWGDAPDAAGGAERVEQKTTHAGGAEFEQRLQQEMRRSFESGRMHGIEESCEIERQAREQALAAEEEIRIWERTALTENFARERDRYFHALEPEVVRLAVAVAARVLRREAATDPLLLLGAVRAALGQVAAAAEVRLRVPAAELDLWTEAVKLLPNAVLRPTILAGEAMTLGDCRIESASGMADLGIRAQLGEIERVLLALPPRQAEQAVYPEPEPVEKGA